MPSDEPLDDRCGAKCKQGGYCTQPPVNGKERCKMHGGLTPTKEENPNQGAPEGNQNAVGNDGGAPPQNQNAQTIGLWANHDGYYHKRPAEERQWMDAFHNALIEQYRDVHGEEPHWSDAEALKNIVIDYHRVARANDWFEDEGLVHKERKSGEDWSKVETKINVWASEIRQHNESIYRRLDKHGLLNSPDKQTANALEDLSSDSYTIVLDDAETED